MSLYYRINIYYARSFDCDVTTNDNAIMLRETRQPISPPILCTALGYFFFGSASDGAESFG